MLQTAFVASCMNQASVFERHKGFKEGRESMRDDENGTTSALQLEEITSKGTRVSCVYYQ